MTTESCICSTTTSDICMRFCIYDEWKLKKNKKQKKMHEYDIGGRKAGSCMCS